MFVVMSMLQIENGSIRLRSRFVEVKRKLRVESLIKYVHFKEEDESFQLGDVHRMRDG
mgnify:CR=1 FL=1